MQVRYSLNGGDCCSSVAVSASAASSAASALSLEQPASINKESKRNSKFFIINPYSVLNCIFRKPTINMSVKKRQFNKIPKKPP